MSLTRRDYMSGLSLGAGAIAFSPFLRSVAAHAVGDATRMPKRFVFVIKASGLDRRNLVPVGLNENVENDHTRENMVSIPLADQELPEALAALEPLKDRLTVIQGLSGKNFSGNHTAGYGVLSCHSSERVPVAETLDHMLGRRFSTGPYPMYAMAMNGSLLGQNTPPSDGYCYPNISAKGKSQAVPFQASPDKAFLELFGTAVMSPAEAKHKVTVQSNLMNFLRTDASRIEKQLSASERDRFHNYTDAFESLRVRETRKVEMADRISRQAPEFTNKYTSKIETVRQACQFDIATAALTIGLTNVVTLRPDTLGTVYKGLGYTKGLHTLGHGGDAGNGFDSPTARKHIDKHHLGLIARMAAKFESIPEGDGTMLDNTLIVYTSCAGGSHHGGQQDWPFVLVGGIANKLKAGQYLQYPTYQQRNHKTIANLYMSILQAAGIEHDNQFGQSDSHLKDLDIAGPLSELMV